MTHLVSYPVEVLSHLHEGNLVELAPRLSDRLNRLRIRLQGIEQMDRILDTSKILERVVSISTSLCSTTGSALTL